MSTHPHLRHRKESTHAVREAQPIPADASIEVIAAAMLQRTFLRAASAEAAQPTMLHRSAATLPLLERE